MPSGLRKTTGNHFEIYYEQPWGGVASDKDPVDIAENQLVVQDGAIIIDGVLCALFLGSDNRSFRFTPAIAGSYIAQLFGLNSAIYGVDQFGYIYYLAVGGSPTFGSLFTPLLNAGVKVLASDGPWAANQPPTATQVVNSNAYVSNFARQTTYVFDGNVTFTVASTYVGGMLFGVLDDYLLQFNTNNITDGPQPNRINWSGPGKFSVWDPSVDRTAGFNTLASVEDQLTAFFSYASVGVAASRKSLIELSPTGVAIGPFSFTALWTSTIGQGCIYPATATQYGQRGMLVTDSDIYAVSTGAGFTPISGSARSVIESDVNAAIAPLSKFFQTVAANVGIYYANCSFPTPFYVIGIVITTGVICWVLDLTSNTWQRTIFTFPGVIAIQIVSTDTYISEVGVVPPGVESVPNPFTLFNLTISTAGVLSSIFVFLNIRKRNQRIPQITPTSLTLQFREEEIKIYRQPTFRRVIVRAYGTGVLTLTVSGVDFGTITLDGTEISSTYISQYGEYTGENPQLTITCPVFSGVIVKAMVAGTYADGEID